MNMNPCHSPLPDLFPEIIYRIICVLPLKTIGRCRCLSRYWRRKLSNQRFASSMLLRPSSVKKVLLVPCVGQQLRVVHEDRPVPERVITFPPGMGSFAGSCKGLCLLVCNDGMKMLMNPLTTHLHPLPPIPDALPPDKSLSIYGIVSDSASDEVRVVVLSFWDLVHTSDPAYTKSISVFMYSVSRGAWNVVHSSKYSESQATRFSSVTVQGAIHYVDESGITAFDVFTGEIRKVGHPPDIPAHKLHKFVACDTAGNLSLMRYKHGYHILWVMREYNIGSSWKLIQFPRCTAFGWMEPICMWSESDLMLLSYYGCVILYNLRERRFTRMRVGGRDTLYGSAGTYTESLVSPFPMP